MPSAVKRKYDHEYKVWRKKVLDKCNSKCVTCGSHKKLHAHHIKSWRNFPELRFSVENGEVLCFECHVKEHPFMVKYYNEKQKRAKKPSNKSLKQSKFNKFIQKNGFTVGTKQEKRFIEKVKQYDNHRFTKEQPNPNWTSVDEVR